VNGDELGDFQIKETEESCENNIRNQIAVFGAKSICGRKLSTIYQSVVEGELGACDAWHAFLQDDCMKTYPAEESKSQLYWLHADELGSSSALTNQAGNVTNWYEYLPFGEMLMEQSSNDYNNPYLYNGKELDAATGLYYYGARYLDPRTSVWLSVDPLAEKMPSWSPYAYGFNNPIRFADPDGRAPFDWVRGQDGSYFWDSRVTSQASAEKYWGKGAEHYAPNAMGYYSGDGQGYALLSDNAKWVRNGVEHTARDMAGTEPLSTKFRNYVVDNKADITATAQAMQTTGDATAVAGLGIAAVGAPVAGVGATPGLVVSGIGSTMSTAGSFLEAGVEIITNDYSNNATGKAVSNTIISTMVDQTVDAVVPGPTPSIKTQTRQVLDEMQKVNRGAVKEVVPRVLEKNEL
jgi:RHS repeat-associated protein